MLHLISSQFLESHFHNLCIFTLMNLTDANGGLTQHWSSGIGEVTDADQIGKPGLNKCPSSAILVLFLTPYEFCKYKFRVTKQDRYCLRNSFKIIDRKSQNRKKRRKINRKFKKSGKTTKSWKTKHRIIGKIDKIGDGDIGKRSVKSEKRQIRKNPENRNIDKIANIDKIETLKNR